MSFTIPIFRARPSPPGEGLHAAFGFPILLGADVLGVIEFFSNEIRRPDQELLDMMATLGSRIGKFIERKTRGTGSAQRAGGSSPALREWRRLAS